MDLRDRIARVAFKTEVGHEPNAQEWERASHYWLSFADQILSIFQDTLDNITDTEELSELQRKIAAMLGEGVSE